jgi:hypothetical protein
LVARWIFAKSLPQLRSLDVPTVVLDGHHRPNRYCMNNLFQLLPRVESINWGDRAAMSLGKCSESDRFLNLSYSVGTKMYCHGTKHLRFVWITQYGNGIFLSFYGVFQPAV